MYAVLHVPDFFLQAVLRLESLPSRADADAPASSGPAKPGTGASPAMPSGVVPRLIQPELDLSVPEPQAEEGPASSPLPVAPMSEALQHASFDLPRGTGSSRPSTADAAPARRTEAEEVRRAADRPLATSHPFALVSSDTRKALILQANAAARAAGVEIGMTAPQAQARCGCILLRSRSPGAEEEARQLLLICGLDVAPLIEDTAPGVCTIDLSGVNAADRSSHLGRAVCQLREQGLHATGGIADTPLLALYAAHQTTAVRTVENASAFLHPLPLAVASPGSALDAILRGWGITTLGQFTSLPQQEVVRRLGAEGQALWERARGGAPRPLRAHTRAAEFHASMELEYEVETTDGVLFLLRRFVDRLALELRTAGFVAAELVLGLVLADETRHERSFRLPEPTAREDVLFRTLTSYLESLRTDAAVIGVSLGVTPTRPLARQPGLFETGLRDPHGFSETLARVTAIVGSGRLGTPALEDTHRADAVVLAPPAPVVPALDRLPVWPPTGLPLRRYRPPLAIHVELTSTGDPIFLSGSSLHSPIAAARGPWRTSGDWWKPEGWAREEWDIELALGGLYRLSRVKGLWYLEGDYE